MEQPNLFYASLPLSDIMSDVAKVTSKRSNLISSPYYSLPLLVKTNQSIVAEDFFDFFLDSFPKLKEQCVHER